MKNPGGQGEAALDDKPFADCQLGLVPQVPHDKIDKQDRRCNNEGRRKKTNQKQEV